MQWCDTMIVPNGAENVGNVAEWMNYAYDPVNAARITEYVNANSSFEVSCWSALFGQPIGTTAFTALVESQAELAAGIGDIGPAVPLGRLDGKRRHLLHGVVLRVIDPEIGDRVGRKRKALLDRFEFPIAAWNQWLAGTWHDRGSSCVASPG